jgi:hypothetical protein
MPQDTDKENLFDDISDIVQEELCEWGTRAKMPDGTPVREWGNATAKRMLDQVQKLFTDPHLHVIRTVPREHAKPGDTVGMARIGPPITRPTFSIEED